MAQTTQQWLPRPGAPVQFLPVLGSLFRHGRRPPFALFDEHQQLIGPDRAATAYISRGDQPALATFVALHLPTFLQDASDSRNAGSTPIAEAVTRALLTALLAQECVQLGGPPPRDVVMVAVFAKIGNNLLGRVPTSIAATALSRDTTSDESQRYTMNTMHAQRPPRSAIALRAATQFRDAPRAPRAHVRHQIPIPVEARMVAITAACTERTSMRPTVNYSRRSARCNA